MFTVIVTEKPSVAQEYIKTLKVKGKREDGFVRAKSCPFPLVNFAFRQKPKCGFYLPTKSVHAPHYPVGRM